MSPRVEQLGGLLRDLRSPDFPMLSREDLIRGLESIGRASDRRCGPRTDLRPALDAMARLGSIASSRDLGRALVSEITCERACSLGRTRLHQMRREGWVVDHDLGGWSITDAGYAAASEAVA